MTVTRISVSRLLQLSLGTFLLQLSGANAQVSAALALIEDSECPCTDENGNCKEPVCPAGFYKCCFDCKVSICAKEALGFWPDGALTLSNRGVMECIQCKPGDYCAGCDTYTECEQDESTTGDVNTGPKISAPGSVSTRECQKCPEGYDANMDRERCVPPFRSDCDLKLLELCMLGCKDNPLEEECEKMRCRLYCANEQKSSNPKCVKSFEEECVKMNTVESGSSTQTVTTTPGLANFASDSGIAQIVPIETLLSQACIPAIECSSAARVAVGVGAIVVSALMIFM